MGERSPSLTGWLVTPALWLQGQAAQSSTRLDEAASSFQPPFPVGKVTQLVHRTPGLPSGGRVSTPAQGLRSPQRKTPENFRVHTLSFPS